MQVRFARCTMEYPSSRMGQLRDSGPWLHDLPALQQRMNEDGYLLFRGLVDRDKVLRARQTILDDMAERGGLEADTRPLEGVMGRGGKSVAMMGRKGITHHPAVRAVLEGPELFDFYNRYFDQPALTFDYKWLRAVGHEEFTGAHYDVVYMGRGSDNLLTCWLPLGDIPVDMGTLAICVGSHRQPEFEPLRRTYGRMDVDRDRIDGWFSENPSQIIEQFGGHWATTDFQAGDMITFGMFTMHASTTNTSRLWRLSCDVRYQPAADPVDERWVGDNPIGHYAWQHDSPDNKPMAQARAEWGL